MHEQERFSSPLTHPQAEQRGPPPGHTSGLDRWPQAVYQNYSLLVLHVNKISFWYILTEGSTRSEEEFSQINIFQLEYFNINAKECYIFLPWGSDTSSDRVPSETVSADPPCYFFLELHSPGCLRQSSRFKSSLYSCPQSSERRACTATAISAPPLVTSSPRSGVFGEPPSICSPWVPLLTQCTVVRACPGPTASGRVAGSPTLRPQNRVA